MPAVDAPRDGLAQMSGIRDMVRISDARLRGTADRTLVLDVAPEAVHGGPLADVNVLVGRPVLTACAIPTENPGFP